MTTFSIIVPGFNTAPLVGETIQSVLDQTRSDWEIIVVDDASTDDFVATVEPYLTDPRVRLLRNPRNLGIAATRNVALEEARGRLVVPLDSDDLLLPEYLQAAAEALEDDQVAVYSPNALRQFLPSRRYDPRNYYEAARVPYELEPSKQFRRLLRGNYLIPMSTARTAAVRAAGGWRVDASGIEDFDLWMRLLRAGGHIAMDLETRAVYRVRAGSIMHSAGGDGYNAAAHERQLRLYRWVLSEMPLDDSERHAAEAGLRRASAEFHRDLARGALQDGENAGARRHSRAAARLRPTPRAVATALAILAAPRLSRWAVADKTRRLQRSHLGDPDG